MRGRDAAARRAGRAAVGRGRPRDRRRLGPRRRADPELRPAAAAARCSRSTSTPRTRRRTTRADVVLAEDASARAPRSPSGCATRPLDGLADRLHEVRAAACGALDARALRFLDAIRFAVPDDGDRGRRHVHPRLLAGRLPHAGAPAQAADPARLGHARLRVPGPLGAALAGAGPVVAIAGDGGFLYAAGELATVAQEQIPLTLVIVDDGGYGMLRYDQDVTGADRYGVDLVTPDFAALARSFGIRAQQVDGLDDEFGEALAAHVERPRAERARRAPRRSRSSRRRTPRRTGTGASRADGRARARARVPARPPPPAPSGRRTPRRPRSPGCRTRRRAPPRRRSPRAPTSARRRSTSSSSCRACAARRRPSRSRTSRSSPTGLEPADEDEAKHLIGNAWKPLDEHTALEALDVASEAVRDVLADGPLIKDEFHQRADRARARRTCAGGARAAASTTCTRRCGARPASAACWRSSAATAARPCSARRRPRRPSTTRAARSRAATCRCTGPRRPLLFRYWACLTLPHAKRLLARAGELAQVGDGLGARRGRRRSRPPAPRARGCCRTSTRWRAPRTARSSCPTRRVRKRIWASLGGPGMALVDGEVAGLWRPAQEGQAARRRARAAAHAHAARARRARRRGGAPRAVPRRRDRRAGSPDPRVVGLRPNNSLRSRA